MHLVILGVLILLLIIAIRVARSVARYPVKFCVVTVIMLLSWGLTESLGSPCKTDSMKQVCTKW